MWPKVTNGHSEARAFWPGPAMNGAHLWVTEGGDESRGSTSLTAKTCDESKHPKDIGDRVQPKRRTSGPSSVVGVKREYVRRSDLCTSHLVILP